MTMRSQIGKYWELTYRNRFIENGVARLSATMTPSGGGSSETPVFRFIGGDADATDWTTWDYPETPVDCVRQIVGVAPTYNWGSPCLGSNDDSVLCHASDYYAAPDNNFGQVATEDMVLEAVTWDADTAPSCYAGTRSTGIGWMLYSNNATAKMYIQDASGSVNPTSGAGDLIVNAWNHILVFADRSGSLQYYINGAASGAATDISAKSATLTVAQPMGLGARSGGGLACDGAIAYLALWKKAAWLTSHLNADTALERFLMLTGHYPQVAKGTVLPNTATRAYAAYLEKIESSKTRLYMVGSEWLRLAQRIDANSDTITGYLAEPQSTNDLDESNDFSGWTKEDVGDVVTDDDSTGPDNMTSMAELVCSSAVGNHGISDQTPGALSAADHCFSVYIGTGNATWVKLVDSTVANAHCWFNIRDGELGTKGAGCDEAGFVNDEYLGTGTNVRRPYIRFDGTAAQHTFLIRPVDGDNDDNFSGGDDASATLYLYGAQVEEGDHPTSYIPTDGAAATRLKDQLQFKGDDGNLGGVGSEERGTIEVGLLLPSKTSTNWGVGPIVISDGGAATDYIQAIPQVGSGLSLDIRASGGNNGDVDKAGTNYCDNEYHRLRYVWTTDDIRMSIDGSHVGQDTSCDIPDDLDEIDIGQSRGSALQFNGLISDIKIWRRDKKR